MERTEENLCHLTFTPGEINGFIAKFESLANKAGYLLNNRSTITLFVSKLVTIQWIVARLGLSRLGVEFSACCEISFFRGREPLRQVVLMIM